MQKRYITEVNIQNKNFQQMRYRGRYLKRTQVIYDKSTANIKHISKKMEVFLVILRTSQGCTLSTFLNVVREVTFRATKQEKVARVI